MAITPGEPPFGLAYLVLYACIVGAVWFVVAARRKQRGGALTAVGAISLFNGTLIAALGALHTSAVVIGAVSGEGPGGTFVYTFRFYALVQLGLLLIAGGVACFVPVAGLARGELRAWNTTMWGTGVLLVVSLLLIPVQGPALTPFMLVNIVALLTTRKHFVRPAPTTGGSATVLDAT